MTFEKTVATNLNFIKVVASLSVVVSLVIVAVWKKDLDCFPSLLTASIATGDFSHSSPSKCFLRRYSQRDVEKCVQRRGENAKSSHQRKMIVFVGGNEMKRLMMSYAYQFHREPNNTQSKTTSTPSTDNVRRDLLSNHVDTEFLYQPYPNSTFHNLLKHWKKTDDTCPHAIVIGLSPSDFETQNEINLDEFFNKINYMKFELDLVSQKTKLLWTIVNNKNFGGSKDSLVYQEYAKRTYQVLKGTHAKIWSLSNHTKGDSGDQDKNTPFSFEVQVLNNYLCNPWQPEVQMSKFCCSSKTTENFNKKEPLVSIIIFACVAICIIFVWWLWRKFAFWNHLKNFTRHLSKLFPKRRFEELPLPDYEESIEKRFQSYLILFVKFILICGYFYLCDRTNLFEKEKKSFCFESFYLPLIVCVIVSFIFQAQSGSPKILNRDMTEEWKGWMQIMILIYHYSGASANLHIYMQIRILVSSYLFLTGYGNFCYYWQGGKLTLRRYAQVMLRMNILTVVLCLVMDRPYQFYYFVPLVSFWYTSLYLVLLLPPRIDLRAEGQPGATDKDYVLTAAKFGLFFVLITAVSLSKDVFDGIFLIPFWRDLFELPGQADNEWWFRWKLDRYSLLYGAVFGLIYKYMTRNNEMEEGEPAPQSTWRIALPVLLGATMISSYILLFVVCSTKQECNLLHPFVLWIPILGYILLRNLTEELRSTYSVVMAATGKISLELFICQYHIWLAADTRGTLVLIRWIHPVFNVFLVSVLFLYVASEVHNMTGEFVRLILPKDDRRMTINLSILAGIFICIKLAHHGNIF